MEESYCQACSIWVLIWFMESIFYKNGLFQRVALHFLKIWAKEHLPHKVGKITRCDIAFARSIKSLKGCIGLECLRLAQVLPAKFNPLLTFSSVRQYFG